MENLPMQEAAAFFAQLASKSPDEDFSEDELTGLVAQCRQVCAAAGYPLDAASAVMRDEWPEELERDEEGWDSALREAIRDIWLNYVWPILEDLFAGESAMLPAQTSVVYLEGRILKEEPLALRGSTGAPVREFLVELFYELLRDSPFPFGQCQVCHKVFVQSRRKPRRYCSTVCKAKGIPSAANHTAYVRELRRQARNREITRARKIIQKQPDPQDQLQRLRKEFPRKSRRQLLHLIKQANKSEAGKED